MASRDERLRRVMEDFAKTVKILIDSGYHTGDVYGAAATLVLAARIDELDQDLVSGLPTAGEGL